MSVWCLSVCLSTHKWKIADNNYFVMLRWHLRALAYLPLGHLGHAPPPLGRRPKCSKLKFSHTAIIAARVVKQRRQRDSVWFVHKTVKVVFFPQILFAPLLEVFKRLRQLNESSTASQEHSPTGSISNNCSTIDMAKHHVLEYRRCCKTSFHCSS